MTRVLPLLTLSAIACAAVLAQESKQLDACMAKAKTQLAINTCADREARREDAELNRVYQELLSAANDDSRAVEKRKAAERAWIAYRDAYLEAMYPAEDKQASYGSIFPTEFALTRADLTQQQIKALQEILKRYRGSR